MTINPKAVLAAAVLLLAGTLTTPGRAMDQLDAPETVTIDALADLYKPVEFSHKPCPTGPLQGLPPPHHRSAGHGPQLRPLPRSVARDRAGELPGLPHQKAVLPRTGDCRQQPQHLPHRQAWAEGAYHLNCVPCHIKKNGPSECDSCHALTDKGRDFFHAGGEKNGKAGPAKGKDEHAR